MKELRHPWPRHPETGWKLRVPLAPPSRVQWYSGWGILCPSAPVLGGILKHSHVLIQTEAWGLPGCHIPSCQSSSSFSLRISRRLGSHPPSLTNYFILLQMANCAKGQSHSPTFQRLPSCFLETHTKDRLWLSHCGQLAPRGLRGCGMGPRIIQTRCQCFFCSSNQVPN